VTFKAQGFKSRARMDLYILGVSPNSHGPMSLVGEAKIAEIEIKPLDPRKGETRSPEFVAKNPYHCCPTIEDRASGTVVWESNAVLRFIANQFKLEQWYPTDPLQRARVDQALDYRQTGLYPALQKYIYPVMGWGAPLDEAAAAAAAKNLSTVLDEFEKYYLKDGKFVSGFETPTIADLAVAPPLAFLAARPDFVVPAATKAYADRVAAAVPSLGPLTGALNGYIQHVLTPK